MRQSDVVRVQFGGVALSVIKYVSAPIVLVVIESIVVVVNSSVVKDPVEFPILNKKVPESNSPSVLVAFFVILSVATFFVLLNVQRTESPGETNIPDVVP